ncbi:MAG: MerC domain-containing protein [bacterium]|nr:MerC domain-containing protein [bacterium]
MSVETTVQKSRRWFDTVSVALSGLCLIHCLLTPILVLILPFTVAINQIEESFHHWLLWGILPSSCIALTLGCLRHKDRAVLVLGVSGLFIVTLTAAYGHEYLSIYYEKFVTTIGSFFLISGHIRNYLLCRKCDCKE